MQHNASSLRLSEAVKAHAAFVASLGSKDTTDEREEDQSIEIIEAVRKRSNKRQKTNASATAHRLEPPNTVQVEG